MHSRKALTSIITECHNHDRRNSVFASLHRRHRAYLRHLQVTALAHKSENRLSTPVWYGCGVRRERGRISAEFDRAGCDLRRQCHAPGAGTKGRSLGRTTPAHMGSRRGHRDRAGRAGGRRGDGRRWRRDRRGPLTRHAPRRPRAFTGCCREGVHIVRHKTILDTVVLVSAGTPWTTPPGRNQCHTRNCSPPRRSSPTRRSCQHPQTPASPEDRKPPPAEAVLRHLGLPPAAVSHGHLTGLV